MTESAMSTVDPAADYATFVSPLTIQFLPALLKLAAVQPGERVLDLAAGPGDATLEAAWRAGPQGEVLGIDRSPAFVALAHQHALDAGLSEVRFTPMDAAALDLPSSYWDVVICHLGIAEFEDPQAVLKEIQRVLRPVGRVAFSTWGESSRSPWLAIPYDAAHSVRPAIPRAAAALPFRYGEPGVLSRVLADAGYADVTPDRTAVALEYATAADYWQAIERGLAYAGGPLASLSSDELERVYEAGAAALRGWQHPRHKRLHLPAQAFLAVAVK